MRRKGIFTLFITVFSIVAFAGMAFAAQNVVLKTTVPDIPKSVCYQAGTTTWELDNNTVLTNGDVIKFSLNNNVTICKSFNFYLRLHDGTAAVCPTFIASLAGDPVTATDPGAALDTLNLGVVGFGAGLDYGLLVRGVAGAQTFTMTVVERDAGGLVNTATAFTLTFIADAGNPTNVMTVKFFDEKFGAPYFWKDNPATTPAVDYLTATIAEDNAICIDTLTQDYMGEYVETTPDSLPAPAGIPLAFSGDYRIAHIVAIERTELSECKGAQVGHIRIGDSVTQALDTCDTFDFEVAGTGLPGNGYCTDHNGLNRLIIHSMDAPFVLDNYELRLEILVNGLTGDRGVYFSTTDPLTVGDPTLTGACAALPGAAAIGAKTMFLADGVTGSAGAAPGADCTIAAADRAVILTTAGDPMNLVAGDDYMLINLPPLNYNLADIDEGDVVTIRVTLNRLPCGMIGPFDITIGTFGCDAIAVANTLLYPYFTNFDSTVWWNGIAIDNLGAIAGTATLYLFEKDGDIGQAVVAVDPQSQYVDLLANITWTVAVAGGSGVIGDVTGYIIACTDFTADGFAMIANDGTGESMGYLPRVAVAVCPVVIP